MADERFPNADRIEAAYERMGYALGWRFLYSLVDTLRRADCAVITLNPGGDRFHSPLFSFEHGNSYVDETWPGEERGGHPIQRQVQRVFALLAQRPSDVLSGVYVPFRSPNWRSLPDKRGALSFARTLWEPVFAAHSPATIVCVGKQVVGREMSRLLDARLVKRASSGWGKIKLDLYLHARGRIIVTPHLSRFTIFGRERGDAAFLDLLGFKDGSSAQR